MIQGFNQITKGHGNATVVTHIEEVVLLPIDVPPTF